jgi:hypothetical protein
VREEERFGSKFMRVDVPMKGDPATHGWATHFYSGPAIFSMTPTDEATVMKKNLPWDAPHRLTYREPEKNASGFDFEADTSDEPAEEALEPGDDEAAA